MYSTPVSHTDERQMSSSRLSWVAANSLAGVASVALLFGCGARTGLETKGTSPPGNVGGPSAVLFGGYDDVTPVRSDTWTFDGTSWTELSVVAPSPRMWGVMAPRNGVLVAFGGQDIDATSLPTDTWAFSGNAWSVLDVSGAPPRTAAVMAPVSNGLVLFGGLSETGYPLGDTWMFDGATWTALSVSGPPARTNAVMAPLNGKAVLFGGGGEMGTLTDTWTFDGTMWEELNVPGPTGLNGASRVVVAPLNDTLVLVTGDNSTPVRPAATWTFDGATWVQLEVTGPPGRAEAVMAPVHGQLVLFGGLNDGNNNTLDDTWTFDGTTWTELSVPGPAGRYDAVMATP
jgi:N-acetylneuraminic acid mutarotase